MVKKPMKKWKILLIIVLIISIGGGGIYLSWWRNDRNLLQVTITEVTRADVMKTFSTSAPVESKSQSIFQVLDGVKVLTVNVEVGDVVNANDVLATFDTSSLYDKYSAVEADYYKAVTKYEDALKAAMTAADALPAIEAEIAKLEAETDSASSASSSGIADILNNLNILELLLNGGDVTSLLGDAFGAQSSLLQLQLQKVVLETQMSESYLNTLKASCDDAKNTYDIYVSQLNSLKNGWRAEKYGIVSVVNIKAGDVYVYTKESTTDILNGLDLTSILGSMTGEADLSALISMLTGASSTDNTVSGIGVGMVVENYDEFVAKFSLGKYDMPNIRLGQKAIVRSVNDEYEGEVTYISATASSSSSLDISSMLGSLTGSSGGSSNAADGIVTIKNPNEGIVIGFDVEIKIVTEEVFNVLVVPVEAIRLIDGERCVYIYNENSRTVSLRPITVGISDDAKWEIIEGVNEGDKVVRTFSASTKLVSDGMRVKLADK